MPAQDQDQKLLLHMQARAFLYFEKEYHPVTGLVADKNAPGWPASIAATGLALACFPIAVERGLIARNTAIERSLRTLRFFRDSEQSDAKNATGFKGFYYHFLDADSGKRAWKSELSSVDTAFLIGGMLAAAAYFDGDRAEEREIRELAQFLYQRVEWDWVLTKDGHIGHGWWPESGFIPYKWEGYDESLLMQLLALGSPTHPVPSEAYTNWTRTFAWKRCYDIDFLYSAPLFTHQLSHMWLDLRGIQDDFMRAHGIDYFENTRRASHVQRAYAIDNPQGFKGYGENTWGITASDGPGPATRMIDGVERHFYDYEGRGAPFGLDDGTLAPWAVAASLPYAPEIVVPAIHHYVHALELHDCHYYGFRSTFNRTYDGDPNAPCGWQSRWHFGINVGPIVAMTENHLGNGGLWALMRRVPALVEGFKRAHFSGGWLADAT